MRGSWVLASLACLTSAACGGKAAPPAHGEALVVVDTDLPVPTLAGRLRVDLYDEHGVWFESRDIGRSDPSDWPASFSVYSDDDAHDKRVLVRLRAYPEGAVRDYAGERFEAREDYREPRPAASLAELCANAPTLPLGGRITARRGGVPLTEIVAEPLAPLGNEGACSPPTRTGSIAAKVTVVTSGTYRFDVADSLPYMAESTLVLRSSCEDPTSQLACAAEATAPPFSSGHLPRFDVHLEPGTYYLLTAGSRAGWPADLTLESLPIDQPLPAEAPGADAGARPTSGPVLVRSDGTAATPTSEPVPTAAVDRLVLVRLVPAQRGRVRVTLHAACAGTMARLGADPGIPDAATASTCVDSEGTREPLTEAPLEADMTRPVASVHGSAAREIPCTGAPPEGVSAACVPGGAFLFGGHLVPAVSVLELATPERIARMTPFFMDRYEVSVARFRQAMTGGFAVDPMSIATNDGPFAAPNGDLTGYCTWSSQPLGREELPLTCVTWATARAFCRSFGGDLPTEAQWEYAATSAGRPLKTLFPWGDQDATCAQAVLDRAPAALTVAQGRCAALGVGPAPVTLAGGSGGQAGDVTPTGIVGLGGNVAEWVRDGGEPLTSPCWRAAGATDPTCAEENAPLRSQRGSTWLDDQRPSASRTVIPGDIAVGVPRQLTAQANLGFRCVYPGTAP